MLMTPKFISPAQFFTHTTDLHNKLPNCYSTWMSHGHLKFDTSQNELLTTLPMNVPPEDFPHLRGNFIPSVTQIPFPPLCLSNLGTPCNLLHNQDAFRMKGSIITYCSQTTGLN